MHAVISNLDQITILLHQYDSLSAQLRQFDADQFQICNLAVIGETAMVALWANNKLTVRAMVIASGVFGALLFSSWVFVDALVATASTKMKVMEAQVNTLAGHRLLDWETNYGSGGILGRYVVNASSRESLEKWLLKNPAPASTASQNPGLSKR